MRDAFEEAPIAYVYKAVDSLIIQANRAAMQILGVEPEEKDEDPFEDHQQRLDYEGS